MKSELKLKHLAPYLPYGLKCHGAGIYTDESVDDQTFEPKVLTIIGLDPEFASTGHQVGDNVMLEDCYPILQPLSNFGEIQFENFHRELSNIPNFGHYWLSWMVDGDDLSETIIEWCVMDMLCEYHYDVFGLIEKGLAIDVNTLKDNPYSE